MRGGLKVRGSLEVAGLRYEAHSPPFHYHPNYVITLNRTSWWCTLSVYLSAAHNYSIVINNKIYVTSTIFIVSKLFIEVQFSKCLLQFTNSKNIVYGGLIWICTVQLANVMVLGVSVCVVERVVSVGKVTGLVGSTSLPFSKSLTSFSCLSLVRLYDRTPGHEQNNGQYVILTLKLFFLLYCAMISPTLIY